MSELSITEMFNRFKAFSSSSMSLPDDISELRNSAVSIRNELRASVARATTRAVEQIKKESGVGEVNVLCDKLRDICRQASSKCRTNINDAAVNVVKVGEYISSTTELLYHPIPIVITGLTKDEAPDIKIGDMEYIRAVGKALRTKTPIERMDYLSQLIVYILDDINNASRKYKKLCERCEHISGKSSEGIQARVAKDKFTLVLASMVHRLNTCLKKFYETRRQVMNRIIGMTECMYMKLDDVCIDGVMDANDISIICEKMVNTDMNYNKKGTRK
jgi:hypothetical protein